MPNPKDAFNTPHNYFDFLTASKDDDFEGQYFDRKEASRAGQDIKNLKKQLVSYSENAICETIDAHPKAWVRAGSQNIGADEYQRERLKRDKRIHDFERAICCPFNLRDIDTKVLTEFKESYLAEASYDWQDEELLSNAGAIRYQDEKCFFTHAGFLFFALNPQRELVWANLRLVRFEVNLVDFESRGLPTYDKTFKGCLSEQIRKIRTLLRDNGFFKIYQQRNPEGGFIEEPEYPYLALDEAIVNAVAHRDYGTQLPIECFAYKDALVVRNPGKLLQRYQEVPPEFSLQDKVLESMPRNPLLMEWLQRIRDEKGITFVKVLSEGTRRMRDEMKAAALPAPRYEVNHVSTRLTLFNNALERERQFSPNPNLPRDKKTYDFERAICCPFNLRDIDTKVLTEFRKSYLAEASYDWTDEELLYNAGAITYQDEKCFFTHAGFLFFALNPQRELAWTYLRLLRFEVNLEDSKSRGLPTYDKTFNGCLSQQIRKIRTILRDSRFFKIYQQRHPEGGFIEEPEYPYLALDEAIVNAVAHRDYEIQQPIKCIAYKDAWVVENPGKLLQHQKVPPAFSLQDKALESMPRNPLLIEWLRRIRDEKGITFVKALSEGTQRMRDEMKVAHLPAPHYEVNHTSTRVTLFNNALEL